MSKPYKYKVKLKRGVGIKCLKVFLKIFKRRPEVINLSGGELEPKAIYLSNHAGADGPMTYEMYFPLLLTGWGASPMFGNAKERWNYLYHTFYIQKLHWNKAKAFIVATLFTPISKMIYRAIGLIPTYTDSRFITSVKTSCKILDENSPILIFPEDSTKGYINPPESFNKGFLTLAKLYYKTKKVDLPVYSMYLIGGKKRKIVIAPPIYVNQMLAEGKTEDEICAIALETMQKLYYENK
ncbi:MAG: hypothetical protein ACI4MS_05285 [Candidatus Coproplasma sp.]